MAVKYSHLAVYRLALLGGIRIALFGPPSVGKTTQIGEFVQSGFIGVPEYASILMQQAKSCARIGGLELPKKFGDPVAPKLKELFERLGVYHPFVDNPAFQEALTLGCMKQEHPYVEKGLKGLVCFDRTRLDAFAYCEHFGIEPPPSLKVINPPPSEWIDIGFLLQPFGTFVDNGIRIENPDAAHEFARIIGPRLKGVYRRYGVKVISVPPLQRKDPKKSIAARQAFMWKHITKFAERKLEKFGESVA